MFEIWQGGDYRILGHLGPDTHMYLHPVLARSFPKFCFLSGSIHPPAGTGQRDLIEILRDIVHVLDPA